MLAFYFYVGARLVHSESMTIDAAIRLQRRMIAHGIEAEIVHSVP